MKPLLPLLCLILASCAGPGPCDVLRVDYSARQAVLGTKVFPVALGRAAGGKPRSYRTPVGEFRVYAKTPNHRFGPVLKLAGKSSDGYEQIGRGIFVHKAFCGFNHDKPLGYTHGCIGLRPEDLGYVFNHLDVGDLVQIKL